MIPDSVKILTWNIIYFKIGSKNENVFKSTAYFLQVQRIMMLKVVLKAAQMPVMSKNCDSDDSPVTPLSDINLLNVYNRISSWFALKYILKTQFDASWEEKVRSIENLTNILAHEGDLPPASYISSLHL